jgi:hypothetical protein
MILMRLAISIFAFALLGLAFSLSAGTSQAENQARDIAALTRR